MHINIIITKKALIIIQFKKLCISLIDGLTITKKKGEITVAKKMK